MIVSSLRRCSLCLSSHSTIPIHSPLPYPPLLLLIPLRFLSVNPNEEDSPTLSLLVETLGFTPEAALSVCGKLRTNNSENVGSVISFFKGRGFTADQIRSMVRRFPEILRQHPERNLLPKLEFLGSKGLLGPDLGEFISSHPVILKRSLERFIIPNFNFYRTILESDKRAASPNIAIAPNMRYLLDNGVSKSNIAALLHRDDTVLHSSRARLREAMRVLKEMGLDPKKSTFQHALMAVLRMSKSSWESKARLYRNWGWSEAELLSAFRKYPLCMAVSEDKINRVMSFFVDRMGWRPSLIAEHPILLTQSLEKKTIPRALVLQFLHSKDMFEKHYSLAHFFKMSEKAFLERIARYQEAAPHILAIYKDEMNKPR
ncbi:uncharacterized protein LOC116215733 [Punica granatum]|uniref:Uncharacterized protein LOC116215733 n=1 Tax=Punica granatum TaxID=22663 RepID=A0A6P8EQV2_PUNGR|nr:uncharacterized protein LOC116215733 [Punica granatum]